MPNCGDLCVQAFPSSLKFGVLGVSDDSVDASVIPGCFVCVFLSIIPVMMVLVGLDALTMRVPDQHTDLLGDKHSPVQFTEVWCTWGI